MGIIKLRKEILALAVPAIVANLTTPLLGLADMAISGHLGNPMLIAAVALGSTLFSTLYWLFNFLRMSTTGETAQAYGCNKDIEVALYRPLFLASFFGFVLILLRTPLLDVSLNFMDADEDTASKATAYFNICIWGAPAVLATYVATGWLIGMQNTRATMITAIVTNVVNICASVFLVFVCNWSIEGCATGTLIAQWIGVAVVFGIIVVCYRPKFIALTEIVQLRALLRLLRLNTDIFLRTACLVAVTLWFTHAGAVTNASVLAANALLLQLFMLFSFFIDGFAHAAEALSGKYYGQGNGRDVRALVRVLMFIGLAMAILFSILYTVGGYTFVALLTDEMQVRDVAADYLLWAAIVPLCGFAAFVMDGVLVGLTRTRPMLVAMFLAAASFFGIWFLLQDTLGNHALWLAFDAYLLIRGVVEVIAFIKADF